MSSVARIPAKSSRLEIPAVLLGHLMYGSRRGAGDASSRRWLPVVTGGGVGAQDVRAQQRAGLPNVSRGTAVRASGLGWRSGMRNRLNGGPRDNSRGGEIRTWSSSVDCSV